MFFGNLGHEGWETITSHQHNFTVLKKLSKMKKSSMWSHTGFIDAFFDNELDAIKSDVLNKVGDANRDLMVPEHRFKRYMYAFVLLTFGILTYIAYK